MNTSHHPRFDFDHWAGIFPLHRFGMNGKMFGTQISSPSDVILIESIRQSCGKDHSLGDAVPVDTFVWSTAEPVAPYLTKIGGVPHREKARPWPLRKDGMPFTFVAQFCFLDSKDIVTKRLPDDVMLVYFPEKNGYYMGGEEHIKVEWSSVKLESPLTEREMPPSEFTVPCLSGVIHRSHDYPNSGDVFENQGYSFSYLFANSQGTKIGRETYFIQFDPRQPGDELFCTLSSVAPKRSWPFVDMETLDSEQEYRNLQFADSGCIYFILESNGEIACIHDCY